MYVGEKIVIRAAARNPLTGALITDAVARVEFYAPGKRVKTRPEDRIVDYGPFPLSYQPATESYVVFVDTENWAKGKWTCKVTLSGSYDSWEYHTFTLKA